MIPAGLFVGFFVGFVLLWMFIVWADRHHAEATHWAEQRPAEVYDWSQEPDL